MRPLLQTDSKDAKLKTAPWLISKDANTVTDTSNKQANTYKFDKVFDESSTTTDVYEFVRPLVTSVLSGLNSTIFVYGQTSSGKTYTMQGSSAESQGIVQLAGKDLFDGISNDKENRDYSVRVRFIEIYNEEVRDLFCPATDANGSKGSVLQVREDRKGDVFVESKEKSVTSLTNLMHLLVIGEKQRSIKATEMNGKSSRSHTIFSITIESKVRDTKTEASTFPTSSTSTTAPKNTSEVRISTLNLVDLAGNEAISDNMAQKKEGININRSLSYLSQVIKKLTNKSGHVPYRNTQLTYILQPYLAGNSRIVMICCASSSKLCHKQTRSTLNFAKSVKRVKTRAVVNNKKPSYRKIMELENKITSLEAKLASSNATNAVLTKEKEDAFATTPEEIYATKLEFKAQIADSNIEKENEITPSLKHETGIADTQAAAKLGYEATIASVNDITGSTSDYDSIMNEAAVNNTTLHNTPLPGVKTSDELKWRKGVLDEGSKDGNIVLTLHPTLGIDFKSDSEEDEEPHTQVDITTTAADNDSNPEDKPGYLVENYDVLLYTNSETGDDSPAPSPSHEKNKKPDAKDDLADNDEDKDNREKEVIAKCTKKINKKANKPANKSSSVTHDENPPPIVRKPSQTPIIIKDIIEDNKFLVDRARKGYSKVNEGSKNLRNLQFFLVKKEGKVRWCTKRKEYVVNVTYMNVGKAERGESYNCTPWETCDVNISAIFLVRGIEVWVKDVSYVMQSGEFARIENAVESCHDDIDVGDELVLGNAERYEDNMKAIKQFRENYGLFTIPKKYSTFDRYDKPLKVGRNMMDWKTNQSVPLGMKVHIQDLVEIGYVEAGEDGTFLICALSKLPKAKRDLMNKDLQYI